MKISNKITKLVEFTIYQQILPNFSHVFFLRYPQNVSKESNIVHEDFLHLYSNDQNSQIPLRFMCWIFEKKIISYNWQNFAENTHFTLGKHNFPKII